MAQADNQEPLGLSKLIPLSRVLVRQKTTVFSGNKYVVTDPGGEPLLHAEEKGGVPLLGAKQRPFQINIYNTQDQEVITLRRPYTFGSGKMQVTVCGQPASVVRQEVTFMKPVLNINDASDRPALRVKGPSVTTAECDFKVLSLNKSQIGVIRRAWTSPRSAIGTDAYHLEFPPDMELQYKAALIGTCFLIDFLYYEN